MERVGTPVASQPTVCTTRPEGAVCGICGAGSGATVWYCPVSVDSDLEATLDDGPAEPTLVPGYLLRGTLGQGGMGAVFLVESVETGRFFALKRLTNLKSTIHIKRFRREIEALQQLDVPGIVRIVDHGDHDGSPWFAMEWVRGPSLGDVLARNPKLAVAESIRIVTEVARTVQRVHDTGQVHRDIKPSNIVLTTEGHPVLVDFGLVRQVDPEAHTAYTRRPIGTPAYMAPELLKSGDVDWVRVDVYSLGAVLARCVLGRMPQGDWDLSGCPPSLLPVLEQALCSQPERRFSTASAFIDALARPEPAAWPGVLAGIGALALIAGAVTVCAPAPELEADVDALLVPFTEHLRSDPTAADDVFDTLLGKVDARTAQRLWVGRAERLASAEAWAEAWANSDDADKTAVVHGLAGALWTDRNYPALRALFESRQETVSLLPNAGEMWAGIQAYHLLPLDSSDQLPHGIGPVMELFEQARTVAVHPQDSARLWTCDDLGECVASDGEVAEVAAGARFITAPDGRLLSWEPGRVSVVGEDTRICEVPADLRPYVSDWWDGRAQLVSTGRRPDLHRLELATCELEQHPDHAAWASSYVNGAIPWDADGDGVDELAVLAGPPFNYEVRLYDVDDRLVDVYPIGSVSHAAVWNGNLVVTLDKPHGNGEVFDWIQPLGAYELTLTDGKLELVAQRPGFWRDVESADIDGDGVEELFLIDHLSVLWVWSATSDRPIHIGRIWSLAARQMDDDEAMELVVAFVDDRRVVLGDGGSVPLAAPPLSSASETGDPAIDSALELHAMGLTTIAASRLAREALSRPMQDAPWKTVAMLQWQAGRTDAAIDAWAQLGRSGDPAGYTRAIRAALQTGDIAAATALVAEAGRPVPEQLQAALAPELIDFSRVPRRFALRSPLARWNPDREVLQVQSMGGAGEVLALGLERTSTVAGFQLDLTLDQLEFDADVRIRLVDGDDSGIYLRVHAFGSRHKVGRTITAQHYELGDILDDDPYGPHPSSVIVAMDGEDVVFRQIFPDGTEKRQEYHASTQGPLRLVVALDGSPGAMADLSLHRLTLWGLTATDKPDLSEAPGLTRALRNTRLRTSPALERVTVNDQEQLDALYDTYGLAWKMHRSASRLADRLVALPGLDDPAMGAAHPGLSLLRADAMLARGEVAGGAEVLERVPITDRNCVKRALLLWSAREALTDGAGVAEAEKQVRACGVTEAELATGRWSLGLD